MCLCIVYMNYRYFIHAVFLSGSYAICSFFSLLPCLQVSETRWSLSVLNGPQYELCSTYPQLMYIPKGIDVSWSIVVVFCMV